LDKRAAVLAEDMLQGEGTVNRLSARETKMHGMGGHLPATPHAGSTLLS
jgi:hypothetical protein